MPKRADPNETSGKKYTRAAFINFYGREQGLMFWDAGAPKKQSAPTEGLRPPGKLGKGQMTSGVMHAAQSALASGPATSTALRALKAARQADIEQLKEVVAAKQEELAEKQAELEREAWLTAKTMEDAQELYTGDGTASAKDGAPAERKAKAKNKHATQIDTQPEQGCRDFPPEEMRKRTWLFARFRKVAEAFCFEEYDAPMIEPEQLYTRKAGEEIVDQMYSFETKGGHRVALRPEMTPSLARLVMQKGQSMRLPAKWYSIPQCWRYEAITRGRRREHYQWNMDILGVTGVTAEAECIAAMCRLFQSCGITSADVGIKVNSRKLLQTVLDKAGVPPEKFAPVCVVVDKIEKQPREEIERMLEELGIESSIIGSILSTLALKDMDAMKAAVGADTEVVAELQELFRLVEAYGLSDWVQFDASVVRGLAYYTGVVFEGFDRQGKLRSICGGGRYDRLIDGTYGHPQQIAACGFGFGDCVIVELLKDKDLIPELHPGVQDLVILQSEAMRSNAIRVMDTLRDAGRAVDIMLEQKRSLRQAFSYADRIGADRAILVAPEEWDNGEVTVKMLRKGDGEGEKDRGTRVKVKDLR